MIVWDKMKLWKIWNKMECFRFTSIFLFFALVNLHLRIVRSYFNFLIKWRGGEEVGGVAWMERVWEMMAGVWTRVAQSAHLQMGTHSCRMKEKLFCASQTRPPRGWKDSIKDFYPFFFHFALLSLSPDLAYLGKTGRRQWDSRCVFCVVSIVDIEI